MALTEIVAARTLDSMSVEQLSPYSLLPVPNRSGLVTPIRRFQSWYSVLLLATYQLSGPAAILPNAVNSPWAGFRPKRQGWRIPLGPLSEGTLFVTNEHPQVLNALLYGFQLITSHG